MTHIYIISFHLPFIIYIVLRYLYMFFRSCNIVCIKKKENISSIHNSNTLYETEIFLVFNFFILSNQRIRMLLNSPASQIMQRFFPDEKDLSNEMV